MADCVALARETGAAVAERFGVPVYLYEEAASAPARRNLEDIRRGEFEGLAAKMAAAGVGARLRAGGAASQRPARRSIGARMPLIAYNINLATDRLDVAKKIAAAVRHSSGGLRYVKAMGIALEDRGIVQVSMNLTNYEKTPIFRVFEARQARGGALRRRGARKRDRRPGPAAALHRRGRVLPAARRLHARSGAGEPAARGRTQGKRRSTGRPTHRHCDCRRRSRPLLRRSSSARRRDGAMPNARIFRYRLLRSTPSTSAVRDMLPCCAASARRM